jgi:hypothetical protein
VIPDADRTDITLSERIDASRMKRMALGDSNQRQDESFKDAIFLEGEAGIH